MTRPPQDDDRAAWIGSLFDQFAAGLYRYALMILADPAGAGDAVQQVFLGLAGRRTRDIECSEHYLRRAVRNECYSSLRRRRRETGTGEPLLEPAAVDAHPDERLAIEAALRTLPADQREVVHLKVFEGMTFQEIADHLDESINTVASRYRYALEKMRAQLVRSVRL